MSWYGLVREVLAVLDKDVRSEFRTRYAANSIALFAVTALAVVSFSVTPYSLDADVRAAFLWIVLFFSAMTGLSRSFVREEESRTAMALRLACLPNAVYLGKLLFNIGLLGAIETIVVPLFFVLMDTTPGHIGLFLAALVFGTIALAASTTIVAAIISRANAKGALFAVLSFPLALPGLGASIRATVVAFSGGGLPQAAGDIRLLIGHGVIMMALSLLLFEFVWND
ncbi:MAG: heme exporter protein CcmB [Firmicutes bacterium]|jgi:heme exporter protein B|nr:heme exporter protein CcmB [Bacillota bacterium]